MDARGKLTIFFGAAPGVGKTYAMLEAARAELDRKRDVVIGCVETHKRYDTEALVLGFELIPRRRVEKEGITLAELDIDAVLARKPEIVILDDLAHTNAPGARHIKRWQDAEEIRDAGIDVLATLGVQDLESLNDVVARITGVTVRETVPDAVFDEASVVRLVDSPVEGNLIALRELALRRTAERVDAQVRGYKAEQGIDQTWHTGERVLVCVSASPYSKQLVRAARRMATSLHAELVGVYVETPAAIRMSSSDRERLAENMRLVEQLGGEAVTLRGEDAPVEIVAHARKRNVTKIVVGKPTHARWRDILVPSFLDRIVRIGSEIDVHVISGLERGDTERVLEDDKVAPLVSRFSGYLASVGMVALATIVCRTVLWRITAFGHDQLADVAMTYLLAVVLVAMRFRYGPSLVAAVLSVVSFDFFFVEPYFTLGVAELRRMVTFGVLFLVAVVISHLTKRIRDQADSARARERRTASLYAISRELATAQTRERILTTAARHVREIFGASVAVFLPVPDGDGHEHDDELARVLADEDFSDPEESVTSTWVWTHQKSAGLGTDTLPDARALYVPIDGARGRAGVLGLVPAERLRLHNPDERQLLETFARLTGSAIERTQLADEARRAQLRIETEQLRNALLSSVSHDLRTPLAVVTGATSALLDAAAPKDEATRRELLQTAHDESLRLTRLVRNLLDMTRLEAGLEPKKELHPVEEVVGAALNRLEDRLEGRAVSTHIPADLPFVPIDPALVEQVLINLLENATKYTPPKTPIDVSASRVEDRVVVEVADRGPGIDAAHAERVFDKFYRVREREGGGVGLGLTICRGIIEAHGGTIWVEEREGGGASFRFTLPVGGGANATLTQPSSISPASSGAREG